MKKIIFFTAVFVLVQSVAWTQTLPEKGKNLSVDAEINWLMIYKREYEKYSQEAQTNSAKIIKRDSVYKLYTDQIQTIYNAPKIYLTHIERAIKNNKVEYDGSHRILYDYVNFSLPYTPEFHFIDRLELYKIIKTYIFDRKGALLPQRTEAYIKAGGVERLSMPLNYIK